MKLYICEKPSLAAAVAENLGKPIKKDGYFEVGGDGLKSALLMLISLPSLGG